MPFNRKASNGTAESDLVPYEPAAGRTPRDTSHHGMLTADISWVYQNLARKNVQPDDAPSQGAFALWQVAIENPKWFIQNTMPKTLPSKEEQQQATTDEEDLARQLELIRIAEKVIHEAANVYGH